MARPQKFRHSRESLTDPVVARQLGALVLDIETLRMKRKQIDDQIAAAFDTVDDAGFEKKFVRQAIALRAKDDDARFEQEQGVEAYEIAIAKGVSLVRTRRELETDDEFDPETGELKSHSDARNVANTENDHVDRSALARTAAAETLDALTGQIEPQIKAIETFDGNASLAAREGEKPLHPIPPNAAGSSPDLAAIKATGVALTAPVAANFKLRPNCQNPDLCAGVGKTHCHACTKSVSATLQHEAVA